MMVEKISKSPVTGEKLRCEHRHAKLFLLNKWSADLGMFFKTLCWHCDFMLTKYLTPIRNSSQKPKFSKPEEISEFSQ
jgi:hypothetical protein